MMAERFRCPTSGIGSIERVYKVTCCHCVDVAYFGSTVPDAATKAQAGSVIRKEGWKVTSKGWRCPACSA